MKIAMVGDVGSIMERARPPSRLGQLCTALSRRGHAVTVYTRDTGGPQGDWTDDTANVRIVQVPVGPARPLTTDELVPFLGDFACHLEDDWSIDRPDVVHAHSVSYGIAAQLVASRYGIPAVQGFVPGELSGVRQWRGERGERSNLEVVLAKRAAWVTVGCKDDMLTLLRLGATRSRMSVLARGVDVKLFTPKAIHADRGASRVVAVVPDLTRDHGLGPLIRALHSVPQVELVVVSDGGDGGDGEDAGLIRLAESARVADRVRVIGAVPYAELPKLLASADVVACTRTSAPAETVALEAMAAGVPLIASAVGDLLDIVVHDITGLLVDPSDSAGFAHALRALVDDPFRRQGMGFAGRSRARTRYTWDRIATDALAVYGRVGVEGDAPKLAGSTSTGHGNSR